jgi:fibronectin-binding autotransporter adhesin
MNRSTQLTAAAILLFAMLGSVRAQTYIWTGVGDGWRGPTAPTGSGSENLVFGDAVRDVIHLPSTFGVSMLQFTRNDTFRFVPSGASTALTITGGIDASGLTGLRADFAGSIVTTLSGAQTWDLGSVGTALFHGKLGGTAGLTVTGESQTLLLANTSGNASDFTGTLTLSPKSTAAIGSFANLVLWGADSIGTGNVVFTNGGNLITHGAPTLANNFTFNSGPLLSGQVAYTPVVFRMWDGPGTTLTGGITLANNTTLSANIGFANKIPNEFPGNTGVRPLPGPITRNPLLISGNIVETGGARSLNVIGAGIIILGGTNSYTGGTNVGFSPNLTSGVNANGNGSLIFATQGAIPVTGTILSGQANNTPNTGYVGIATSAVPNAGDFATFLAKFNPGSTGAVGLDSLTGGLPSGSPSTFSDNINLTGFNTTAFEGIRLGTATSVRLIGPIVPQLAANYNFGNGGGKLYVLSNLGNHTTSTYLAANNNGVALMLYLQGANTYNGGTYANNGFIIFDGASAIPATGILRAGGSAANIGASYLGFTNATLGGFAVNGATLASGLLTRFDKPGTWGIVGFDTNTPGTPTTVNNLDLTGFNDGVFIGTTSEAVLTGTITPTTVATANAAHTYRFTAADGGTLVVDSALVDGANARSVSIGIPTSSAFQKLGDGKVVLNSPNSYTGGTTINTRGNITVSAATDTAFGTGTITLGTQGFQSGLVGLSAATAGRNFANNIVFAQAAAGTGFTPGFMLTGSHDFTLSGNISGPTLANAVTEANPNGTGVGLIGLSNPTPINVTLTGDNSGYYGNWHVQNGTLIFASANAAGHGTLQLDSDNATAAFTASGTLHGINGKNGGRLHVNNGLTLTFDTSVADGYYEYGGTITAPGNTNTTAGVVVTASAPGEILYLYGNNQYSGGTSITGHGVLGLGTSSSAGTGAITINATNGQGGLILNDSVTLTNAIVLNQGVLGGLGTFAPTSFNGTPGAPITIGANQGIFPGVPDDFFPGKLTFTGNTVFANGGGLVFGLQDASHAEGYGSLFITGNLDLTSVSLAAFDLHLESYDAFGEEGLAAGITLGNSYQFTLIETGGTISGFSADKFVIDSSLFQNDLYPAAAFSLTADSQHIYLNFHAVPEPSTYALLALGSGWVLATLRRRRRT